MTKKQDLTADFVNLHGEVKALDKRGCEIVCECIKDGLKAGDSKNAEGSYSQAAFVLVYLRTLVRCHADNNGWEIQP